MSYKIEMQAFLHSAESFVRRTIKAEVAELADAHGSGPCARKGVGVRVPSSAPLEKGFRSVLDCRGLALSRVILANCRDSVSAEGQLRYFGIQGSKVFRCGSTKRVLEFCT